MRENTRCEVEEPMSTPTLRTTISSSSTSERPVEEKKMRPPSSSSVMIRAAVLAASGAKDSVCSLSQRERGGVRGCDLSRGFEPPHPNPLPFGERERTEFAACSVDQKRDVESRAREFRHHRALLVEIGLHPARHALGLEL